mmetsp:Transcript_71781/g.207908  ORF Transcript_71781/g.207908 Transcript_71781/m.207908 type:complete len:219 (-) Transcript_71781:104-760(-)
MAAAVSTDPRGTPLVPSDPRPSPARTLWWAHRRNSLSGTAALARVEFALWLPSATTTTSPDQSSQRILRRSAGGALSALCRYRDWSASTWQGQPRNANDPQRMRKCHCLAASPARATCLPPGSKGPTGRHLRRPPTEPARQHRPMACRPAYSRRPPTDAPAARLSQRFRRQRTVKGSKPLRRSIHDWRPSHAPHKPNLCLRCPRNPHKGPGRSRPQKP